MYRTIATLFRQIAWLAYETISLIRRLLRCKQPSVLSDHVDLFFDNPAHGIVFAYYMLNMRTGLNCVVSPVLTITYADLREHPLTLIREKIGVLRSANCGGEVVFYTNGMGGIDLSQYRYRIGVSIYADVISVTAARRVRGRRHLQSIDTSDMSHLDLDNETLSGAICCCVSRFGEL